MQQIFKIQTTMILKNILLLKNLQGDMDILNLIF